MGLLDWLGIGGGQDPAQAAPGLLGGDTRGIRNQAFYSALMPIAAGLLAHGQRRPVGSPSPLPEALAAFGPTYQRGLLGGYQQQALERQAGEAERFNQMIAALPPDQQQQARLMGPERYGAYVAQRQLQDSDPRRRFMAVGTSLVDLSRFGGGAGGSPTGPMMAGQPGAAPGAAPGAMPPAVAGGARGPGGGREVAPGVYSFAAPQAAGGAGGPFRGTSIEAQDSNILLRGDPNSAEYALAYARQSQPRMQSIPDPNNPMGTILAEVRPDMTHVRPPTFRPGQAAPAQTAQAPIGPVEGGYVAGGAGAMDRALAAGQPAQAPAAPMAVQPGAPPQIAGPAQPGASRVTQVGEPRLPPATLERVRAAEVEATRTLSAIDEFERVANRADFGARLNAYIQNPTSADAAELNQAFNNLTMVMRSPALLNTGVLQPAEQAMIVRTLNDPTSLRGAFMTPGARSAQIAQIRRMVQANLEAERRSIAPQGRPALQPMPDENGLGSRATPHRPRTTQERDNLPDGAYYYDPMGVLRQRRRSDGAGRQ